MIPKFRAWHKEYTVMANVLRLDFICNQVWVDVALHEDDMGEIIEHKWDIDKIELMQWTGLNDANGNEIFEGDIIRIEEDGETDYGKVRFSDGMFWVMPVMLFDDYALSQYTECPDYKVGVIGNIYENFELLEANK